MLKGKVCLVSGGSSGIGAAIVRAFAAERATVFFSYLKHADEAKELACKCNTEMAHHMDVRDRQSIRRMFKAIADSVGHIDVLVNNAGINEPNDFDKQTDSEWNDVIDVDLTGVFRCCQEALPFIADNGSIINIGSLSGEYGGPRTPSYAAAKAGVMALTHCAARFLAHRKIRVNCISPGVIGNEFTENTMHPEVRQLLDNMLLLKRPGRTEEVASLAVFLASDRSKYITAQTIGINGGAWV
jgi:NAD(P)-dependent dehydrogenase (short-subunit alcohol dehydrogenase family)